MAENKNKKAPAKKKAVAKEVKVRVIKCICRLRMRPLRKGAITMMDEDLAKKYMARGVVELYTSPVLDDAVKIIQEAGGKIEVVDDAKGQKLVEILAKQAKGN